MICNYQLPVLFLSFFLFLSCQDINNNKPSSASREGEVLVIVPDALWEGQVGDSLRQILAQPVTGLSSYEPLYKVIQIERSELGNTLKLYRNVLIIHNNDNGHLDKPLTAQFDKWAKPQIVLNLYGISNESLLKNIAKYGKTITSYYSKEELKRKTRSYKNLADKRIQSKLNELFNLNVAIPKGYKWSFNNDEIAWIRNETNKTGQSIIIYKQAVPEEEITPRFIIDSRNAFSKKYIPGSEEGSYMKTAGEEFLVFDQVKLAGIDAIRTKGLWDVAGDYMGGPFISYTFQHQDQLITIEGFVYAPGKSKYAYVKQLNAIINTLELRP
ncbi:MAG: DUF4837 family protein [Bacteroidia bacterium]|nr:DUF4837 family protein [Bacteroidia bacterium]NNC84781.1 DUF4837 family protein [Bacteroidia bacterium]